MAWHSLLNESKQFTDMCHDMVAASSIRLNYTILMKAQKSLKRRDGFEGNWVHRDRKIDKEKGKAPSASSSSVYIHYPCYSGVWLAWLNYRYIIINHVALFIFIQHQSIYNPEGREAVGAVPGLCGVICWIIMHTAEWGTGAMLSWLFQLSPELCALDLIAHPDTALPPKCKYNHWNILTANTLTEAHSAICKYCTLWIELVVF